MMTKKTQAVVDRISEGTKAVLLAEALQKEFIVPIDTVDIDLREGLWVDLTLSDDGHILSIEANEKVTEEKEAKVEDIMARLRKRKGSKYKR